MGKWPTYHKTALEYTAVFVNDGVIEVIIDVW